VSESNPKDRTWLYVGLAFVIFWGIYLIFFNAKIALEGTALEVPADFSWKLEDLDGKAVALADFRGRPIFLNIWATWCPPCRSEMPSIVKLASDPRLKGIAFLAVTNEPPTPSVKKYAREEMRGLTVLRSDRMPDVFVTEGIPATFVIAPDGKVIASQVGSMNWDDPKVVDLLEGLVKKTAPPKPTPDRP
jgi:thiol-disulfide isomerase/thioredoxin